MKPTRLVIISFVIVILCIGSFYLGKSQQSDINKTYSMLESDFIEYQLFKEKLNEMFPYYEPDGNAYKEKLFTYFTQKEAESYTLYKEIIESTIGESKNVTEDLQKFHKVFPEYKEAVCALREELWLGGSGRSASILSCEIYETEKYINLLNIYHERFVPKSTST